MAENKESDVRIAGEGTLAGGDYGNITINGAGSVRGDAVCGRLRINGAGDCKGAVRAEEIVINGTGSFGKELQAVVMNVNGDASVRDGLGVRDLKVKGRLNVGGGMAGVDADVRGEIRVGGDLEAEKFVGEGVFTIGGLLNADSVDFRIHGKSSAREIGGERVVIRLPRGFNALSALMLWGDKRLTVDAIEADDVSLENVTANVVRGARVEIGDGCDIGLVEYTEELRREGGGTIKEERKVEPTA